MAWLSGWGYRRPIVIPSVTAEQTDINAEVTVTFESGMKSDFADIRFTEADGTTLLYHFMDKYTASTSALFVVKIPVLPIAGKTLYLYYGNTSAVTASDGANTFPFFDDFSGDLSKWNTTGSDEESCYIENNTLKIVLTWGYLGDVVRTLDYYSMYYAFVVRAIHAGGNGTHIYGFALGDGTAASILRWMYRYSRVIPTIGRLHWTSSGYLDTEPLATGGSLSPRESWSKIKIRRKHDGVATETCILTFNDGTPLEKALTVTPATKRMTISAGASNPSATLWVDEAYIMKYPQDGTELSPITPGDEEAQPATHPGRIRIKHTCCAKEGLSDSEGSDLTVRAGEVVAALSGRSYTTVSDLGITGSIGGYENKKPYYKEAAVNGGSILSSASAANLIYLMNTGRMYVESGSLGTKSDYLVSVYVGDEFVGSLNAGEPLSFKDDNGGLDPSDITIETVETDGSTISSGVGNAVEFLVVD